MAARPALGRTAVAGILLVVLSLAVACGSDEETSGTTSSDAPEQGSAPAAEELDGTEHVSTEVTGREMVDDSRISVSFDDGIMSVSSGCNTMFGPYRLAEGSLAWSETPAATLVACPSEELTAQDEWLTDLLVGGVEVTLADGELTLQDGDTTIALTSSPVDLEALMGRTWTVIGTVADRTTSRLPRGVRRPWLSPGRGGLAQLFTGCNSGRTRVSVDGDDLVFGHASTSRGGCRTAALQTERKVLAMVNDNRSDYVAHHDDLLLVTTDGVGLLFQVR